MLESTLNVLCSSTYVRTQRIHSFFSSAYIYRMLNAHRRRIYFLLCFFCCCWCWCWCNSFLPIETYSRRKITKKRNVKLGIKTQTLYPVKRKPMVEVDLHAEARTNQSIVLPSFTSRFNGIHHLIWAPHLFAYAFQCAFFHIAFWFSAFHICTCYICDKRNGIELNCVRWCWTCCWTKLY